MILIVYTLMYVVVPAILLNLIGGWTFLVYALWLFGSYYAVQKSCEEREHMPMMEHPDQFNETVTEFLKRDYSNNGAKLVICICSLNYRVNVH